MEIAIRNIGNSKGIVLPKPLLAQAGLEGEATAFVLIENGSIVLRKPSKPLREGWAEAAAELASHGGEIFRCTPELGIHRATLDEVGTILVSEDVIRKALSHFDDLEIRENLGAALGSAWDEALEPYRGVDLQEVQRLRAI